MRLPQRIGSYTVTAKIGEGGMGEVWQATDTQLNREVALADPDSGGRECIEGLSARL